MTQIICKYSKEDCPCKNIKCVDCPMEFKELDCYCIECTETWRCNK